MDDKKIWQSYTKTVSRPSRKKPLTPPMSLAALATETPKKREVKKRFPTALPSMARGSGANPSTKPAVKETRFDRRFEKRLRLGDLDIEAALDLHGMTQMEAHAALDRFVAAQVRTGRRIVLIITGKGRLGQSVLRHSVPAWLQTLEDAPSILALRPAAPKHGNAGAYYLILRRTKG
jgi:DNA-nicking Smr family endonuclease